MSNSVAIAAEPDMLKLTNEMREAARRLLTRHNAAEPARADARYEAELAIAERYAQQLGVRANKARVKEVAAREHPGDKDTRKRLEAIADGTRKLVDEVWWRKVYGDVDRAKNDKIAALADPARNSNEHERRVASVKLASAKARRAPGSRPDPPPFPKTLAEWEQLRRKPKPKAPQQPPSPRLSAQLSDSVASAHAPDKLRALNEQRAARRAEKRTGLKCQTCGKSLDARRATARYCSATCRSRAWRT